MIRNLKVFGLAVVALLAMTAFAASAASAAAPEFHAESEPVTYSGSQIGINTFSTPAGAVECEIANFKGSSASKTSTTATIEAEYSECEAFGFLNATVNMNGCDYVFHLVAASSPATANVDVVCPAGKEIEIKASICTVKVPAQTNRSHVIITNTGSGTTRDIDANVTVGSISGSQSFFCPGGSKSFTTGEYTGEATIKGFSGGTQQGIWVE